MLPKQLTHLSDLIAQIRPQWGNLFSLHSLLLTYQSIADKKGIGQNADFIVTITNESKGLAMKGVRS